MSFHFASHSAPTISNNATGGSSNLTKKTLFPHSLSEAFQLIEQNKKDIILLGFGVDWCYPAKKTIKHLHNFSKLRTEIPIFFIDEEKCKDFCKKNDIIVGTPALMIYYQGEPMVFSRGEWEPMNKVKGMLNLKQIEEVINAAFTAIKLKSREIELIF